MAAATTGFTARTKVSADSSRAEIERTLHRYGADLVDQGPTTDIRFRLGARHVRLNLTLPSPADPAFTMFQRAGKVVARQSQVEMLRLYEQACRQRWRALALLIKAKLEAAEAGITTLEDEFLAATLLPDGSTMGEWARPQIDAAYRLGGMPRSPLLDGPGQ